MAYEFTRSHSRSSSTGLASSISCLDGIPFKVGPKFKPPPRVFLPPELTDTSRVLHTLNDEYLFETEDGVLRWAEAREAAKVEQDRINAERTAQSIQVLAQTQESSDSSDAPNDEHFSTTTSTFQSETSLPVPIPPPRPSLNDILTPVPITAIKSEPEVVAKTVNIDLALFEREDDLFDNVDRQLINEMEELKSVLDPVLPSVNAACDSVSYTPCVNSYVPNLKQESASEHFGLSSGPFPVIVPRDNHYQEGDYVELHMDYSKASSASAAYKFDGSAPMKACDNSYVPSEPASKTEVLSNLKSSNIYKQVLPPINGVKHESNDFVDSVSEAGSSSANVGGQVNGVENKYSRYSNVSPTATVQLNDAGLKAAHSSPDLSNSDMQVKASKYPLSHSPPPRPSSGQVSAMWNPYKPLPATPDVMTDSAPTKHDGLIRASPTDLDPFSSLPTESRIFVLNLVSMGFARPQVARAVQLKGTDEKEVVEYLCHVTQLSDKGFNPTHVETALNLFNNSESKAEQYLKMFQQLEELGFSGDRIKEALIKEGMDRDKALDFLTA